MSGDPFGWPPTDVYIFRPKRRGLFLHAEAGTFDPKERQQLRAFSRKGLWRQARRWFSRHVYALPQFVDATPREDGYFFAAATHEGVEK